VSNVINIGAYRAKGVLTLAREFLVLASRGKIAGVRLHLEMKDGTRRKSIGGKLLEQDMECCGAESCTLRAHK
jgi:hypothetical protein